MFTTAIQETYLTPVDVDVPNGDGTSKKFRFKAEFKRQSQEELDEIHRRLDAMKLNDGETVLGDDELLKQVLVGWRDQDLLLDEEKRPAVFSDAARDALLNIYPVRPVLVNAFFTSIQYGKRKN